MERLLALSLFLFQVGIVNTAGVADIYIAFFSMICFFKYKYKRVYFDISIYTLILFLVIILLSSLNANLFNGQAFYNNFIRICSLSIGYFLLPLWFYNNSKRIELLIKSMLFFLMIISILVIIEFICINLDIPIDMRLIYRTEQFKISNRVYTIFSEPSIVGIFIAGFISPVLYYYNNFNKKLKGIKFAFYLSIIALFLTTSFTGFIFAFVMILYFAIYVEKIKNVRTTIILSSLILLIIIVLFAEFGESFYLNRIDNIMAGGDSSANQRLMGGWYYAFSAIQKNELFGIGLGQATKFAELTNIRVEYFSEFNKVVNNSFAAVLLELGYLGLISYLFFLISVFRKNNFLLFVFIFFCFAHGGFIFSFFWFFLYWGRIFNLHHKYKYKLTL